MALPSSIPTLTDPDRLAGWLSEPGVRVLDASWYLPQARRDPDAEFLAAHVPGAVFFDLDASSDPATVLPHMLPSAERFAARMESLGVSDDDLIVAYDSSGTNVSAGRVWWMLRTFGHQRTTVLDGGFQRWRREGRPVESGPQNLPPGRFHAQLNRCAVRDLAAVRQAVHSGAIQIVDARSQGRFEATTPEPRPGLRGGHLPGSRSLPHQELVGPDGRLLPTAELRRRFSAAGIDVGRPVILSCGSGVSACALALALDQLGAEAVSVYDGSWSEWGACEDTPVETGPASPA
ncbi:MAG: 3-mercaptopyruvate sulfurtransferase [Gemmatimonadota bacterium]